MKFRCSSRAEPWNGAFYPCNVIWIDEITPGLHTVAQLTEVCCVFPFFAYRLPQLRRRVHQVRGLAWLIDLLPLIPHVINSFPWLIYCQKNVQICVEIRPQKLEEMMHMFDGKETEICAAIKGQTAKMIWRESISLNNFSRSYPVNIAIVS
jgi:hypothetical protein